MAESKPGEAAFGQDRGHNDKLAMRGPPWSVGSALEVEHAAPNRGHSRPACAY